MKFYKVGGAVRDNYINQLGYMSIKVHDHDYAVEAESYSEMYDYLNKNGKIWQERPEFFTIRARMPEKGDCDFVLCRSDGSYSDGRHPDSVSIGTIYDDLARRDFTMNAIAIDESGNYIDPFNGRQHIHDKIIYCVNDTETQMKADSLRMMRAIRLSVTKNMNICYDIDHFLKDWKNYELLNNAGSDRIRDEMNKMWEFNPGAAFYMMCAYRGLFNSIFLNNDIWMKATQEER